MHFHLSPFYNIHNVGAILTGIGVDCIEFVKHDREIIYEYAGSVDVIAQAQWDQYHAKEAQSAGWKVRGTVKLQRIDSKTLAASVRFWFCFFEYSINLLVSNRFGLQSFDTPSKSSCISCYCEQCWLNIAGYVKGTNFESRVCSTDWKWTKQQQN